MATTTMITIDASAFSSIDFNQFLYDYFASAGASSYKFYGGTVDTFYGRPYFMNGSQIGMTYGTTSNQVVVEGADLAYNFIHYGNGVHSITGSVDTLTFGSYDSGTTYTETSTTRSELTGVIPGLVISGLDLYAAAGSATTYNIADGTGNLVHALYDALTGAGTSTASVDALYALLGLSAQHFLGTTGNDNYTGTIFDDLIEGNGGNDTIDGGDGNDTFVVSGNLSAFTVTNNGNGTFSVGNGTWTATLTNIESITFNDGSLNIAETPSNLSISKSKVAENSAKGTVVATVSAVDPNGDTLTYTLTNNAGGRFALVTKNGVTQLVVNGVLDHEASASYDVTIKVSDGINSQTKTFAIGVTDVNEAPTDITLSKNSVAEDAKVGSTVAVLSATDPDGDAISYSLSSNPGGFFEIKGNKLILAKELNYEDSTSQTIKIVAKDADGLSSSTSVKIGVTDVLDIVAGSSKADILKGDSGADKISGYAGNDKLYGYAGDDQLFGGLGKDYLDGGNGDDMLFGGAGNDTLLGGAGNDVLEGGNGKDVLKGGAGNDELYGGKGADKLYGGAGADTFVFLAASESRVNGAGRDTIFDFNGKEGDRIDLSDFDANSVERGMQDFTYIGKNAFSGEAGELRVTKALGNTLISGDTDGDGLADFAIALAGAVNVRESYFLF
ncbi:cadherin domain-containing protein [Sinorhizobium sp. BG8]|uniref:cadherin domain-containing protein n=1 Tax=Sinorhizobium sp. BG8 TaxID=2613773 RepID=UPI00193E6A97|nr:cadherin domain-containing protein [Sinorhizobium sp. BG8]QRM56369.1 hypothetical protein F3Y30_18870 [Sinorhizobium sp. BG8]